MIKSFIFFLVIFSTSLSFAEGEVEFREIEESVSESVNPEEVKSLGQELKEIGYNRLDFQALLDPKVTKIIAEQFDASNISLKSIDQKRKHFQDEFQGTLVNEVLNKAPKVRDVIIDIVTDKKSMMGLMSILQKEKERMTFLYAMITFFILNLILKKTLIAKTSNFFVRFFQRSIINLFSFSLSLGVLFYLFSKELSPILDVVKTHL